MAKTRKRTESASPDESRFQPHSGEQELHPGADPGESRDRIATRAYELYLQRGGADGGAFDDWLAAEREVGSASLGGPNQGGRGE